jgi:hypothetical protein
LHLTWLTGSAKIVERINIKILIRVAIAIRHAGNANRSADFLPAERYLKYGNNYKVRLAQSGFGNIYIIR